MNPQRDIDTHQTLAAVLWVVVAGTLALGLLPGLVGGFVDHLHFSEQSAGLVAAAQLFGSAFGLLIPTLYMTRMNLRSTAVSAMVLVLLCDGISAATQGAVMLALFRFCAGAGAGVLLGIAIGILSARRNPDAGFGFALVAQFGVGSLGLYLLPRLFTSIGMPGTFLAMASVSAVGLAAASWLPKQTSHATRLGEGAPLKRLLTRTVILVLLAFSFFYISNGAQWAYLDRIGTAAGLAVDQVGTALAISMLFGIVGAVAAALAAGRCSRRTALFVGTGIAVAASILLTREPGVALYGLAACGVNFSLSFVVPFYLGILADCDRTGRIGSIAFVLNFLSMSVGPGAGALIVDGAYDPLLFATAGGYVFSFVLVIYALLLAEKRRHEATGTGGGSRSRSKSAAVRGTFARAGAARCSTLPGSSTGP